MAQEKRSSMNKSAGMTHVHEWSTRGDSHVRGRLLGVSGNPTWRRSKDIGELI